jgi:hypothetical protein
MKRDLNLIRTLLQKIEAEQSLTVAGITRVTIDFQLLLMIEAGLILGAQYREGNELNNTTHVLVQRLTNKGYDFLELSRSQKLWTRFLTKAAKAGGGMTIELASEVLHSWLKRLILK